MSVDTSESESDLWAEALDDSSDDDNTARSAIRPRHRPLPTVVRKKVRKRASLTRNIVCMYVHV